MKVTRDMVRRASMHLARHNIWMHEGDVRTLLVAAVGEVPDGVPPELVAAFAQHMQDTKASMERLVRRLDAFIKTEKGDAPS